MTKREEKNKECLDPDPAGALQVSLNPHSEPAMIAAPVMESLLALISCVYAYQCAYMCMNVIV